MSEQEFEQMDEQVINMVNAHSTLEDAANAERITKPAPKIIEKDPEKTVQREIRNMWVREATSRRKRETRMAVLGLFLCLIVAAALLVVLVKPEWLVWLVNVGVAACCTIAGIILDRRIRRSGV